MFKLLILKSKKPQKKQEKLISQYVSKDFVVYMVSDVVNKTNHLHFCKNPGSKVVRPKKLFFSFWPKILN